MTNGLDPDITAIQEHWLTVYRPTHRWIIVQEPEGFSVHDHSIDGVGPPSDYKTKVEAAARLLQLLGIKEPVTPQNWPERVCIGYVSSLSDTGETPKS